MVFSSQVWVLREAAATILAEREKDKDSIYGITDATWANRTLKRLENHHAEDEVTIGYTGETGRNGDS
jgi:hypothetical protein